MTHPLRVGIPIPSDHPTSGGGYVFQAMIFEEILKRQHNHTSNHFVRYIPLALKENCARHWGLGTNDFLDLSPCLRQPTQPSPRQRLIRRAKKLFGHGQLPVDARPDIHRVLQVSIDISWSLTHVPPSDQTPFAITIWDLQHRLQPFFPEVSREGEWESRESAYSYFAKKATFCVVGTQRGKQELCHFYSIDPDRVLVNPFPCPPSSTVIRDPSRDDIRGLAGECYLFYPAQFWSHKNHLTLLHAFSLSARSRPDLKLVLTGSDKGSFAGLKQAIDQLGIDRQVICLGFVDRSDIYFLYRHATCLVFPSFFGPDNLPPLEAISYGIPALVADVPGAREQYGDTVDYFDPFEPHSISEAIDSLLLQRMTSQDRVLARKDLLARLSPSAYVDVFERALFRHRFPLYCARLLGRNATSLE